MSENAGSQKCIFCLQYFDELTEEHVIPDALGGSLIIRAVCKDCNSYLGSHVDAHLSSNLIAELERYKRGLLGRRKRLKHPLSFGKLASDPSVAVSIKFDDNGENILTRENSIKYPDFEKGETQLLIDVDASKAEEIPEILKIVGERMLKKGYQIDKSNYKAERIVEKNPVVRFFGKFNLRGMERAMLKIVYEVSYITGGMQFIESEVGGKLRNYIMNDGKNALRLEDLKLRGFIGFKHEIEDPFEILKVDHLIAIDGALPSMVYVRIFDFYLCKISLSEVRVGKSSAIEVIAFNTQNRTHERLKLDQAIAKYFPDSLK